MTAMKRPKSKPKLGPPRGFVRTRQGAFEVVAKPELCEAALALTGSENTELAPIRGRAACVPLPGFPDVKVALRRHLHGGALWALLPRSWQSLYLSPARALAELALYAEASARGVPTIEALALVWQRVVPFGCRLTMLSRWIEDSTDLRSWLEGGSSASRRRRRAAFAAAAGAVRKLHDAGFEHADLHVGNLLVRECASERFEAWVLDLDKTRAHGSPLAPAARIANLLRLHRSVIKRSRGLDDPPGAAELLAFMRGYAPRDREFRRALIRALRRARKWLRLRALFWSRPG